MKRFIVLSFLLMTWGYWELSGGADFELRARPAVAVAAAAPNQTAPQADPQSDPIDLAGIEIATRSDSLTLASSSKIGTLPAPDLPAPDLPAPDLPAPDLPAPDLSGPDLSGPQEALVQALTEALAAPEPAPELAPELAPEPEFRSLATPLAATAPSLPALREVAGDRVNMREGPGRDFAVIEQLTRGMLAEVLEEDGAGWVRVRVEASGLIGWMSADFLTPVNG